MTTTAEIADAVAAELRSGAFTPALAPVRAWMPLYDLGDMVDLHVTVVAAGRVVAPACRGAVQLDHRIEVAVQQKVAVEDPAAVDPVLALVERIAAHLTHQPLASLPQAQWTKTEHAPYVAPEHLHELRQVTSIIAITYRTWEPA
ncbi:MAG: hypothetical protein H0V44_11270 [Planctomycetes bacterium]|nr:hypothetical protein [Planctomycetota bacterium]MBA3707364.1 hypothetical protein [Planctomycetota bacterium]